jgi:hypothetical protein
VTGESCGAVCCSLLTKCSASSSCCRISCVFGSNAQNGPRSKPMRSPLPSRALFGGTLIPTLQIHVCRGTSVG